MKPRYMKPLRWATNAEQAAYMRQRKAENLARALVNSNENWLLEKLQRTGFKWTRQATWGYRIFDFWCHELGIAIESDGPEHNQDYDAHRDEYNMRRSGILVLRVRNRNELDAAAAIVAVAQAETWKERRAKLGLNAHTKAGRRHLVSNQQSLFDDDA
jgi:very-short-patch-repair endonuclease